MKAQPPPFDVADAARQLLKHAKVHTTFIKSADGQSAVYVVKCADCVRVLAAIAATTTDAVDVYELPRPPAKA